MAEYGPLFAGLLTVFVRAAETQSINNGLQLCIEPLRSLGQENDEHLNLALETLAKPEGLKTVDTHVWRLFTGVLLNRLSGGKFNIIEEVIFYGPPPVLQVQDVEMVSEETSSPPTSPSPEFSPFDSESSSSGSAPHSPLASTSKATPVELNMQVEQIPCQIQLVDNESDSKTVSNLELAVENVRRDYLTPENACKWEGKDTLDLVSIGPNGTTVSTEFLVSLDWTSGSQVTRKLLTHIFDREILASHTLTGKPSPAFKDRKTPTKLPLDPLKVADIIHVVTTYTSSSPREVRMAITTKCADENKMMRNRNKKK